MSFPTVLGPWFVVQRLQGYHRNEENGEPEREMEYYTAQEDGGPTWTQDCHRAMLFMSLASAARVALGEVAQVRVLTTKEEAKEFGRS